MRYIKENNQGIIALLKIKNNYEYNAVDSSYCVLEDYEKEIESGEYFSWIQNTKLDYYLMKKDFEEIQESGNTIELADYLIWEKPNIFIDFDKKIFVNFYHDRLFEQMVPSNWNSHYAKSFEEFIEYIPLDLRYWE